MSAWTKPAAVLGDTVPKTVIPTLVAFNKDVWCFWVTSAKHIAYTTSNKVGWGTLKTIHSINTPHKAKPVGKAAQPLVAAAVVGSEMHVVFTATDLARPNNICLRHMAFSPGSRSWGHVEYIDAPGIAGNLNFVRFDGTLAVSWLDDTGKTVGSIKNQNGWVQIQVPNTQKPGSALTPIAQGSLLHLLSFNTTNEVVDFVLASANDSKPAAPVVRQPALTDPAISTVALSATGFLDYLFWVLHKPQTGTFQIFEWSEKGKVKEHKDLTAKALTLPSIQVLGNTCFCVWNDVDSSRLMWSSKPNLAMSVTMNEWMKPLKDSLSVTRLTIPGTHDSGAISYLPYVGCQKLDFTAQLESGIRYFDLRLGYDTVDYGLPPVVHHGAVPIIAWDKRKVYNDRRPENRFLATEVFEAFYDFLNENPSEGLIVQIKRDDFDPQGKVFSDEDNLKFADHIWNLIEPYAGRWLLTNTVPTVGQLRGKIQLVRRFVEGIPAPDTRKPQRKAGFGISVATVWDDNLKSQSIPITDKSSFKLQDFYNLTADSATASPIDVKWNAIRPMLDDAWNAGKPGAPATTADTWFVNFSSGVKKPEGGALNAIRTALSSLWSAGQAHSIATGFFYFPMVPFFSPYGVNDRLLKYFTEPNRPRGGYGTIVIDFPEQPSDLIAALVRTNYSP